MSTALPGVLPWQAFASSTRTYDDGSSAVPPGLLGDPERVIIVGAGWAGLTAANALRSAGVEHVLVEGRNRVGGRAHTRDLDGVPVDLGCSWITAPIGNPMLRFARQVGIGTTNADVELDAPILRFFDAYLDTEVGLVEKVAAVGHGFYFAAVDSAGIAEELGLDASVRDGAQVYLDRSGLTGDARRQAEFVVRFLSEFPSGWDWNELSLRYWSWGNSESSYIGIGQGEFPIGGYRGLVRAMAGAGEVRLRHRVHTIERDRRGVVVRATVGGREVTLRGSHVVVAVPLGVLKSGSIRFEPRLPPAKREVIAKIGFGAVEKVAMVFDEPFWREPLKTHMLFLSDHSPLELPWFVDLDRISGLPGLVAFCGGPFANRLHRMGAEQGRKLALARLAEILGRDVPKPRAVAVTDWQGDPFSCGSYSNIQVGRTNADLEMLATPVGGRVLFAGEATNRARHSLADGAVSTGIREAKRLLRSPSVTITAG